MSGKLQVDVGNGVGVHGLARVDTIAGGKDGGTSMGVVASRMPGLVYEGGRKERLSGGRAFAVEHKEVRLKLKLEIGGSRDKRGREKDSKGKLTLGAGNVPNCKSNDRSSISSGASGASGTSGAREGKECGAAAVGRVCGSPTIQRDRGSAANMATCEAATSWILDIPSPPPLLSIRLPIQRFLAINLIHLALSFLASPWP